jgi:glycine C-acetyltransferase
MKDIFDKTAGDGGYFGPFRARGDHYFTRPVLDPHPGREMTFHGPSTTTSGWPRTRS